MALFSAAATAEALPTNFFGIITDGQYWESEADYQAMGHSGAKTLRFQLNWWQVNQAGGFGSETAWKNTYDKYFEYAAKNGLTILPYLYGRKDGGQRFYTSSDGDWAAWFQFVWTAVQRYGRGGTFWAAHPSLPYKPITTWEVWNEPNLRINNPLIKKENQWIEEPQPRNYAEFFVPTSTTITNAQNEVRKAGEPADTKVLPGGLYQEAGNSLIMSVSEFLSEIAKATTLNNEFKSRNSGLSLHPYSFNGNEAQKLQGVKDNVVAARTALSKYDSPLKPIWITELGWPVPGAEHAVLSEAEQANLIGASFSWLKSSYATYGIELAVVFAYRDAGLGGAKWEKLCGLRDINGVYRPAWFAFLQQTEVPKWPVYWHSGDNLGGNISDDPEISGWPASHLDIVARGANGTFQHKSEENYTWNAMEDFGPPMASGPSAIGQGTNVLQVVHRAADNSVVHRWWEAGNGWHSENLGGNVLGDPEVVSWGAGRLDIFARGTDNTLQHKWFGNGSWSSWESLGGSLVSSPGAVAWSTSRLDVVGRTENNTITHWWWDSSTGWHSGDDLGGNVLGDPDVSSWGPNRLDIFARGTDNTLQHKAYFNGTWSGWESLGGSLVSGPGAVSVSTSLIHVVGRASDNTVTHWWWDSSFGWHGGDNLGGNTVGDPDIASLGPSTLHVFARGADDTLQHKAFANNAWGGWESLGGSPTSGMGAVSWGVGRVDVVGRTPTSGVTHWWFEAGNGWHGGDNLGGNIVGDPDVSSWGPGRLDIFARGTDNTLQHKAYFNGTWSGWESLGGSLVSGPGAVSWSEHRVDVVGRAADNSVTHWWWDDSTGWHSGDNLGGNILGDPSVASWGPNRLDVFGRGPDNTLQHKYYENGTWSGWESLGGSVVSGVSAVSWGLYRIDVVGRAANNSITHWYLE